IGQHWRAPPTFEHLVWSGRGGRRCGRDWRNRNGRRRDWAYRCFLHGLERRRLADHELAGGIGDRLVAFPGPPDDQESKGRERERAEAAFEHRCPTIVPSSDRGNAAIAGKRLILKLGHIALAYRALRIGDDFFARRSIEGLVVLVPGLTPTASNASLKMQSTLSPLRSRNSRAVAWTTTSSPRTSLGTRLSEPSELIR